MIYAVTNRKGGTGKTTTAWAIACGMSASGARVLTVDCDAQGNLTQVMHPEGTAAAVTLYEVLTGSAPAAGAIIQTADGDLLPAGKGLSLADTALDMTGKEYRLKEALQPVLPQYDYVVIDCPPALGILTINALTAADRVIIPAQADVFSLTGIEDLHEAIDPVKKYCNPALAVDGILLTRYNSRAVLSRDLRTLAEQAAAKMGTKVYQQTIREGIAVKEAQAVRQNLFRYAPVAKVTFDYLLFIEELKRG